MLGNRLLKDINVFTDCNKNVSGALHKIYCGNSTQLSKCDPYYLENNVTIHNGIRGLASGVFLGTMHLRTNIAVTILAKFRNVCERTSLCFSLWCVHIFVSRGIFFE